MNQSIASEPSLTIVNESKANELRLTSLNESKANEPSLSEELNISMENMDIRDKPEYVQEEAPELIAELEEYRSNSEEAVIPYGDDIDEMEEKARIERMSRKRCMKSSAHKISRFLRRMEELNSRIPKMSRRAIARQTAQEFSTVRKNCYRCMCGQMYNKVQFT